MYSEKKTNLFFRMAMIVLILIFSVYKIHYGLHFDESLSIAMGDMLEKGSHFLSENWSPLQFTGIFLAPIIRLYRGVNGNLDGVLLLMRYLYLLGQFGVALFAYFTIRKVFSEKQAFMVAVLSYFYCFTMYTLQYKTFLYWFSWICLLCLINYYAEQKMRYLILAALSLSACVLGYPGSILMAIPCCICLWQMDRVGTRKRDIALFMGVCVVCAMFFLLTLFLGSTQAKLVEGLQQYFHADAYEEGLLHKLARLGIQTILMGICANGVIMLYYRAKKIWSLRFSLQQYLAMALVFFFCVICLAKIQTVTPSRIWYTMLVAFFWLPFLLHRERIGREEEERKIWFFFLLPSVFMIVSIMTCTNQGLAIPSYGVIFGIFGLVLWVTKERFSWLAAATCSLIAFSFIFFVANQNWNTYIYQQGELVEQGVARGLYLDSEVRRECRAFYTVTRNNVSEEDNLLIISDNWMANGYLDSGAGYATYSPYNVPATTDKLVKFFEINQEKKPTVVIVDLEYIGDWETWLCDTNTGRYLTENYDVSSAKIQDEFAVILK